MPWVRHELGPREIDAAQPLHLGALLPELQRALLRQGLELSALAAMHRALVGEHAHREGGHHHQGRPVEKLRA
jgi:hypothetical protein